jgi:hypothetical protein
MPSTGGGETMTYRVINETRQEIAVEIAERELAIKIAERMADHCDHRERFIVVELTTIYETNLKDDG